MNGPGRSAIVVGGFYRSGTSLVRRILDGHSRIYCGTEAKFWMDLFGRYREDPLAHLRLFATLRSLGADDTLLLERFGPAYLAVLDELSRAHGKPRWADKAPENVLYLDEWGRLLGDGFPFVHCVRHPLDVLASAREAGFPYTLPGEFTELAETLRHFLEAGLAFETEQPRRCFRVRYEDLTHDPPAVAGRLFTFLGEAYEPGTLELHRDRAAGALEDPKIAERERIEGSSVGRWRGDLTAEEVAVARRVCGEVASALGYRW